MIEDVLAKATVTEAATLEEVQAADTYARTTAKRLITEQKALTRLKG